MTDASFTLVPFPDPNVPDIEITGKISRQTNNLRIHFDLRGSVDTILFPEPSLHPTRKSDLWMATCFEFFIALHGQPHYWEFNLSPSGDWNVFRMDAYRRVGFREETSIQRLPFSVQKEAVCVSVEAAADLAPLVEADQSILVGITSIVQSKNGHETYWALKHPAEHADFHLSESFTLEMAG